MIPRISLSITSTIMILLHLSLFTAKNSGVEEKAVSKIVSEIIESSRAGYATSEGEVILVKEDDIIYINLGTEAGIQIDDVLEIVGQTKDCEVLAEVHVTSVQASKLSIGKLKKLVQDKEIRPGLKTHKKHVKKARIALVSFEESRSSQYLILESFLDEIRNQMTSTDLFEIDTGHIVVSREQNPQEIGKTLDVDGILTAELSRKGDIIHLAVRLMDCDSGELIAQSQAEFHADAIPVQGIEKIVVAGLDGLIYVMDMDGSNQRILAPQLGANSTHPCVSLSVSPDGKKIAFYHKEKVWVVNSNGAQLSLLGYKYYGSWQQCATSWVYETNKIVLRDNDNSLSIVDAEGVDSPVYLPGTAWLIPEPNGSKYLLFPAGSNTKSLDLYIADSSLASRKHLAKYINSECVLWSQTWSPDRRRIACWSFDESTYLIDRYDYSSKKLAPKNASITWSQDGSKMLFVHRDDRGVSLLNLAEGDGSNIRVLSTHHKIGMPKFSPDGLQIAVCVQNTPTGLGEICVINLDDLKRTVISRRWIDSWRLLWSSDANKILFTAKTTKEGKHSLYSVNADGSDERMLLGNAQEYFEIFRYPYHESDSELSQETDNALIQEYVAKGYAAFQAGDYLNCYRSFRKAIDSVGTGSISDSELGQYYAGAADGLFRMGNKSEAKTYYQKAFDYGFGPEYTKKMINLCR